MSFPDHAAEPDCHEPCSSPLAASDGPGLDARLRLVRANVFDLMQLAQNLSRPDEAACAALIVDLLEIADCWQAGTDDTRSDQAAAVLEFSESSFAALEQALADEPENSARITQIQHDAQNQWGEYLGLLGPAERTSPDQSDNPWRQLIPPVSAPPDTTEPGPDAACCSQEMSAILAVLATADATANGEATVLAPTTKAATPRRKAAKSVHSKEQHRTRVPSPRVTPSLPLPERLELDPELRSAYLEDAERGVAVMEQTLLELEADPSNTESLQQLGRALHTMKGASASVGLAELARYIHELEDLLQLRSSIENGRFDIQPMLQGVDVVRAQMAALMPGSQGSSTPPAQSIDTEDSKGLIPPSDSPVPSLSLVSHPVATRHSEESIRVEATRLDRLMDLLGELVISRNRRDTQANRLKQLHTELMRTIGRLRLLGESLSDGPMAGPTNRHTACHGFVAKDCEGASVSQQSYLATEIANDISEIAHSLRELYEPVMDENLATSRLMGQFRHELMELRRLPLSGLFLRLQRAARDAAHAEGKQVHFEVRGEHAGLEPSLQERLYEPLLHLVRNAVSHGIESESDRVARGKSPAGTVTIETRGDPTSLVIEVCDDGKGLDYDAIQRRGLESGLLERDRPASPWQLAQLIFQPGFSTRSKVTEVSGRGVGLDVVANVLDRLRGQIEVESSPGQGTAVRLRIPLRSSIEHTMVCLVDGHRFALPMQFVQAAKPTGRDLNSTVRPGSFAGGKPPVTLPDASRVDLPHVRVRDLLSLDGTPRPAEEHTLIISQGALALTRSTETDAAGAIPTRPRPGERVALMVDAVVGPEEVVVRSLPPLFKRHRLLAGVTLSGAGEIVLLLDGRELVERAIEHVAAPAHCAQPQSPADERLASAPRRVLVVDDSVSARRSLSRMLERRGFVVSEAADGLEALHLLRTFTCTLVLTDLEMPRLGGMELLTEIRRSRRTRSLPVVVVTGVRGREAQDRAQELGANGFIAKPVTDASVTQLLTTVRLDGATE